jgi:hypothetical protein
VFFEEFVRRVAAVDLAPDPDIVEMPNAFVFRLRRATIDLTPA